LSCHANGPSGHPTGWANPASHGTRAKATPAASSGFASCQTCHGETFSGGIIQRSCLNTAGCHGAAVSAPHSPAPWRGGTRTHTDTDTGNAPVCALCHTNGANSSRQPFEPAPAGTAPGCFNNTLCHAVTGHAAGWSSPDVHGAAVKTQANGFASCQVCHGANFSGGTALISCSSCHGVSAPHSPKPWRSVTRTHTNTDTGNAPVCALCHLGERTPPSYVPLPTGAQPGCFNSTLCHGNVAAPHPVPFTDPALHGPLAKSDLTYCQGCHADPPTSGAGSNPRFNVSIGNLFAGCENCHATNMAHPTRWRGLTATAPGGHMTAGNPANACALCHGVNLAPGGVGPACSSCHTAGSPLTLTNCTSCHGSPPSGAAYPNQAGAHTVHNALPNVTSICNACHNGGGTKTANHDYERTSPFVSFLSAYDAKSGAATYNAAAVTCSNVSCHGGQTTPVWLNGTIAVDTQCTSCHRPRTTSDQYNSQYSGRHANHSGLTCYTCHSTTLLAVNHFTHLDTTAMEGPASATISSALTYTPGATAGSGSCTAVCHGEIRSW
jgi:predicted CxxxxCH...CXXCH cytochrome family protein